MRRLQVYRKRRDDPERKLYRIVNEHPEFHWLTSWVLEHVFERPAEKFFKKAKAYISDSSKTSA